MFKLIAFKGDIKHIFEASSLDEIMSATVDAFNQNYELFEISKDGKCIYLCNEIYDLIKKTVY